MKHLLITIAAVVLVGCGPSMDIHEAAKSGNIEVIREAINAGVYLNEKTEVWMYTPLHIASAEGHREIVELLITKGADVNIKNYYGFTALDEASRYNHLKCVKLLQKYGVKHGSIRNAVEFGDIDAVKEFLKAGENINEGLAKGGPTPLHYAAQHDRKEIAELLIAKGADLNAERIGGQTPLHKAAQHDRKEIAKLLITKGADLSMSTRDGQTPLHITALYNHLKVAELLIEYGADVNAKANNGRTPLHFASAKNNNEIARLLISKSANVNAERNDGLTPFDEVKAAETADLLRKHGGKTGEELKAEGK